MPKNDNMHAIRLTDNIRENVGEEYAKEFAENFPLAASANIDKKFAWASAACEYLDSHFEPKLVKIIREGCVCNDAKSGVAEMRKCLKGAGSIEEFTERFNTNDDYARLEYVDEHHFILCYPTCYCACVKRINQTLSKSWCYCTVGYSKRLFSQVFPDGVEVELLESIKSGGTRCAIAVTLL